LPIAFLMSLLSIFNNMISLNIFGVSYKALLDLGIMIDINVLKCNGQCLKLIHVLAILIKLLRQDLLLIMTLRSLQDSLSDLGVKVLLHLLMELLNSSLEKGVH